MTTRVEGALNTLLSNDSTVTAAAPGGVWLGRLPQNATLPAATIHRIASQYIVRQDSQLPSCAAHFQISCWGNNPSDPKTLALAITNVLIGFRGIVGGIEIEHIVIANELDLPGISINDFHTALTILVHYKKET